MSRRYRRRTSGDDLLGPLFFLVVFLIIAFSVYVHFFAPCHVIGWLPAKDVPSRCFSIMRH